MNKWKTKFKEIVSFVLGIIFATCSIVLAETCQTTLSSSNVTYEDTTIQAETNELITQAGSIDSRVTTLESYFQNSPTSHFSGSDLVIKSPDSSTNGSLSFLDSANTKRGMLYFAPPYSNMNLVSYNSSGSFGQGELDLYGKPITLNAKSGGTGDINLNGNININGTYITENISPYYVFRRVAPGADNNAIVITYPFQSYRHFQGMLYTRYATYYLSLYYGTTVGSLTAYASKIGDPGHNVSVSISKNNSVITIKETAGWDDFAIMGVDSQNGYDITISATRI